MGGWLHVCYVYIFVFTVHRLAVDQAIRSAYQRYTSAIGLYTRTPVLHVLADR